MDSDESSRELDRLKERTKINFFQLEKRLAEDDLRMDNLEAALKAVGGMKRPDGKIEILPLERTELNEIRTQMAELGRVVKSIEADVSHMKESSKAGSPGMQNPDLEKIRTQIEGLTKNLDFLDEAVRQMKTNPQAAKPGQGGVASERLVEVVDLLSKDLAGLSGEVRDIKSGLKEPRFNADASSIERVNAQVLELRTALRATQAELFQIRQAAPNINAAITPGFDPYKDIKDDLKKFVDKMPELEEKLDMAGKDLHEIDAMRLELGNDRKLYLELRTAVLASIEKFAMMENEFSRRLNELGELNQSVDITRAHNEKMLNQAMGEISRVEENYRQVMENYEKKLRILESQIGERMNLQYEKQNKRIAEFGERSNDVVRQFDRVKSEIVEKTIDEEMNKLLIILNDKLKSLVTYQELDGIKAEIRNKLEQVRSPEIRPLEARIIGLEDDISEIKRLIRGMSQRMPVIVE